MPAAPPRAASPPAAAGGRRCAARPRRWDAGRPAWFSAGSSATPSRKNGSYSTPGRCAQPVEHGAEGALRSRGRGWAAHTCRSAAPGCACAASVSRIAVRLASMSAGSMPRSPSLAPSSTMAASAPSPSAQSSRARPPARGVAGHRAVDDLHVVAVRRAGRRQAAPRSRRRAAGRSRRTANRPAPAAAAARRGAAGGSEPAEQRAPAPITAFRQPAAEAICCRHGCHSAVSGPRRSAIAAGAGQGPAPDRALRRRAGQHPARHRPRHRAPARRSGSSARPVPARPAC